MTMILLLILLGFAWLLALVWAALEFYPLAAPWLSENNEHVGNRAHTTHRHTR